MSRVLFVILVLAHIGLALVAICVGLGHGTAQVLLGAVIASILGAIDAFFGIHFIRVLKHYSAAVKLQLPMMRINESCDRSMDLLRDQINGLRSGTGNGSIKLSTAEFTSIELMPMDITTDLADVVAINNILQLNASIASCNDNQRGITNYFSVVIAPLLNRDLSEEHHKELVASLSYYRQLLEKMVSAYSSVRSDSLNQLLYLRGIDQTKDRLAKILTFFNRQDNSKRILSMREDLLQQLLKEQPARGAERKDGPPS